MIITQGSLGALVFIGSRDLLFMLGLKVDLMLNGMAKAPFRWRTFIPITLALNCYYWKACASLFTDLTQHKMLNNATDANRTLHPCTQVSLGHFIINKLDLNASLGKDDYRMLSFPEHL